MAENGFMQYRLRPHTPWSTWLCPSVFPMIEDRPGGDTRYFKNVPQAILAQTELPTFKFELEKSGGQAGRRLLRQGVQQNLK